LEHQKQESSDNINTELPLVDALVTPNPVPSIRGTLSHVATLQKLQEKEQEIHRQLRRIKELDFTITSPQA
jgi:hypothetical protein